MLDLKFEQYSNSSVPVKNLSSTTVTNLGKEFKFQTITLGNHDPMYIIDDSNYNSIVDMIVIDGKFEDYVGKIINRPDIVAELAILLFHTYNGHFKTKDLSTTWQLINNAVNEVCDRDKAGKLNNSISHLKLSDDQLDNSDKRYLTEMLYICFRDQGIIQNHKSVNRLRKRSKSPTIIDGFAEYITRSKWEELLAGIHWPKINDGELHVTMFASKFCESHQYIERQIMLLANWRDAILQTQKYVKLVLNHDLDKVSDDVKAKLNTSTFLSILGNATFALSSLDDSIKTNNLLASYRLDDVFMIVNNFLHNSSRVKTIAVDEYISYFRCVTIKSHLHKQIKKLGVTIDTSHSIKAEVLMPFSYGHLYQFKKFDDLDNFIEPSVKVLNAFKNSSLLNYYADINERAVLDSDDCVIDYFNFNDKIKNLLALALSDGVYSKSGKLYYKLAISSDIISGFKQLANYSNVFITDDVDKVVLLKSDKIRGTGSVQITDDFNIDSSKLYIANDVKTFKNKPLNMNWNFKILVPYGRTINDVFEKTHSCDLSVTLLNSSYNHKFRCYVNNSFETISGMISGYLKGYGKIAAKVVKDMTSVDEIADYANVRDTVQIHACLTMARFVNDIINNITSVSSVNALVEDTINNVANSLLDSVNKSKRYYGDTDLIANPYLKFDDMFRFSCKVAVGLKYMEYWGLIDKSQYSNLYTLLYWYNMNYVVFVKGN